MALGISLGLRESRSRSLLGRDLPKNARQIPSVWKVAPARHFFSLAFGKNADHYFFPSDEVCGLKGNLPSVFFQGSSPSVFKVPSGLGREKSLGDPLGSESC